VTSLVAAVAPHTKFGKTPTCF